MQPYPLQDVTFMRYALNTSEDRIIPSFSGERAICPLCRDHVAGKCGEIVTWHWSHLSGPNCDPWTESLTDWHLSWQQFLEYYRSANIEVPIKDSHSSHIADAVLPGGKIIELQHSSISPRDIYLREEFYGKKLIWVFDTREAYKSKRFDLRKKGNKNTFRWKQPRKSIAFATRKVFLDLGEGYLFQIKKIYFDTYCGGFGTLHYWQDLHEYEGMNE